MTNETITRTTIPQRIDPTILSRILDESYGPGAWHGADLRAALSDVAPRTAFWRPAPGRHNIAELALHHAWFARSVTGQLSGAGPPPFPIAGADWFELNDKGALSWAEIRRTVDEHQRALAAAVAPPRSRTGSTPLSASERFDLVLGIACHAIYHAGQVQLLKVLATTKER